MPSKELSWKKSARSSLKRVWQQHAKDFKGRDPNRMVVSSDSPSLVTDYMDAHQKKVIASLLPANISSVLDIGCGIGRWTQFFLDRADKVVGVDSSAALLKIAKKNKKAKFLKVSASKLPFKDNSFDVAFACYVFQHLLDEKGLEQVVREAVRVTKPGGRIILLEIVSAKPSLRTYAVYRDPDAYIAAFAKSGARLLDLKGVHFTFPERALTFFCKKVTASLRSPEEKTNRQFWDWLETRGQALNFLVKAPLRASLFLSSIIDPLLAERLLKRFSADRAFVFQKCLDPP